MEDKQKTANLQEMLHSGRTLVLASAPGAYYARLMEQAGVDCFFVGTALILGTMLGVADGGMVTMNETTWLDGFIARSVDTPLMADADTGFGSIMSIRRAVQDLIRAGVSGMRIEDQVGATKRGAGTGGVELAPLDEAVARVRCAVLTKREMDPNFVYIAKTDALDAIEGEAGLNEAIRRLKAYKEAGADVVMLSHPRSVAEIREARAQLDGPFIIGASSLPEVQTVEQHQELGIAIAWYSDLLAFFQFVSSYDYLQQIRENGWNVYLDYKREHKRHPFARIAYDASADEIRRLEDQVWPAKSERS